MSVGHHQLLLDNKAEALSRSSAELMIVKPVGDVPPLRAHTDRPRPIGYSNWVIPAGKEYGG
jgi:hypothetical protein